MSTKDLNRSKTTQYAANLSQKAPPLAKREMLEAEQAIKEQKAIEEHYAKVVPVAKIPEPEPESAEQ